MEKGAKAYIFVWIILLVFLFSIVFFNKITGNVVGDLEESESGEDSNLDGADENIEESSSELNIGNEKECMKICISDGCDSGDLTCMQTNAITCVYKCRVKKSAQTPTISKNCTGECLAQNCDSSDNICIEKNKYKCFKECGKTKIPAAKSEEDNCIRECVNNEDSSLTCIPESDEEISEICTKCIGNCEQLYDGPCLEEVKLETKLKKCEICEDCYGQLIMGNSGEGYECIVNVKCKGTNALDSEKKPGFFSRIANFFKGMFKGDKGSEKQTSDEESNLGDESDNSEDTLTEEE